MKLKVQVKLIPDQTQQAVLKKTMEEINRACNRLSELCFEAGEFHRFGVQAKFYRTIRSEFGLSAQVVIRLIAKVCDAYVKKAKKPLKFRSLGSVSYDCRILEIKTKTESVSIWTLGGRIKCLPFVCGGKQRNLLELKHGESDLIFRGGEWYLSVTVDVPDAKEEEALGWLGIDLGLVNIAQNSDGKTYGDSAKLAGIRDRRNRQRTRLQTRRTRSAKRVLRRIRRRESGFSKQTNHEISKQIVADAKRTKRGIALENLKDIRSRIRARKSSRRTLHSWAFNDLQQKIAYKAKLAGVPVKHVDPRDSSRTCPKCRHVDKRNRATRDHFSCVACGFTADADTNAAREIARRADVNQPNERNGNRVHVQSCASD